MGVGFVFLSFFLREDLMILSNEYWLLIPSVARGDLDF